MVKYKLVQGGLYYQCTQCGSTMKKATTKTHARNCSRNPNPPPANPTASNPSFPVINTALSELLKNQDSDDFRRKRGIRMLSKLPAQDLLRENFVKDAQILADMFSGQYKPSPPSPVEEEEDSEENETLAEKRRKFYATLPLKYQTVDYFRDEKAALLAKLPEDDDEESVEEAEEEPTEAKSKPKKPAGYDRLKMQPELTLEVQRELLETKFRQREEEIAHLYDDD